MQKQRQLIRVTYLPLIAAFLLAGALVAMRRRPAGEPETPSSVVREFLKLELRGVRLEPEGWHKTSSFFVRSSPPRADASITVVSDRFVSKERRLSTTQAQVDLDFERFYGVLDPSLKFRREEDLVPAAMIAKEGMSWSLTLSLVDCYTESRSDGQAPEPIKTQPTWRIDPFQAGVSIDLRTSIRYVTEMRNKTSDAAIKKNADATLAVLRTLK